MGGEREIIFTEVTDVAFVEATQVELADIPEGIRGDMIRFLGIFREEGNVSLSAETARVCARTIPKWRKRWPAFAQAYSEAAEYAADRLEHIAWHWAERGNTRMLMFMLTALRPEKYSPQLRIKAEIPQEAWAELLQKAAGQPALPEGNLRSG